MGVGGSGSSRPAAVHTASSGGLCVTQSGTAQGSQAYTGSVSRPRSLVGCSPWGRSESDTTELLHFHLSLSCIAEGNGKHSSVLAWRTPGTGEPGGLPSMGSHRVGHDCSDLAAAASAVWKAAPLWVELEQCR